MVDHLCVLVEDDEEQAAVAQQLLQDAGFQVVPFVDMSSCQEYLESVENLIDLFVLDRRLPVRGGDTETEEVGDILLDLVRDNFPDSCVIVLTGNTSIPHIQEAQSGGGQLPDGLGSSFQKTRVFEKEQSLEFREAIESFRSVLQRLDDVEILPETNGKPLEELDRRILQRIAVEFSASSVLPTRLGGGLSEARIWKCSLQGVDGDAGTYVAKATKEGTKVGGLQAMLPREYTTASVATITGLVGDKKINLVRLAGDDPISLFESATRNKLAAATQVDKVGEALRSMNQRSRLVTLEEIVKPLISWELLDSNLSTYGISTPSRTLKCTTRFGMRHGDLHFANIMLDEDAPVLIDFDDCGYASGLLDPVTMLLCTLVHPSSPIRGEGWPTTDEIASSLGDPAFGSGSEWSEVFSASMRWVQSAQTSPREFWAVVLGYSARQLKYPDVKAQDPVLSRVLAVVRRAVGELV